ncbi:MAG: YDG domain-containing protein, partial [Paludibacter sp.]
ITFQQATCTMTNSGTIKFNPTTDASVLRAFSTGASGSFSNSGTITVGSGTALTNAIILGDSKTSLTNTGTISIGSGSINGKTGGTDNAAFSNSTNGVLNLNNTTTSAMLVGNTAIAFTNNGGTITTGSTANTVTINTGTPGATFTSGVFSPGGIAANGKVTLTNSVTLAGTTNINVTGISTAGTDYDQIISSTTSAVITVSGALAVTMSALTPADGTTIDIIKSSGTSGTISGTFATITGLATGWSVVYTSNSVQLKFSKTTPIVTVNVGTYTYNGSAQGPNSVTTASPGTVTYSYSGTAYNPTSTRPTNAGTYTVTATVNSDSYYNSASSGAISYTIDKAALTVTGVTATKTYNGTTSSAGSPSVGTLASGDVVNLAPTQVYDDKNYGTTHLLTPSGLTIKNGSNVDMTANYSITYTASPATGVIDKAAVTVTAVTATKTYDGTISSAGSPTVGTLASGDVVNVAAIQTYDNKNYGTSHVLTPSGLTINNGNSVDVTSNYTITYAQSPATGVINKLALTVSGATTADKEYDGLTTASVTSGLLVGVISPDVVELTQAGDFDTKNVGTSKTITANCSIGGADVANYTITQPTLTARDVTAKPLSIDGTSIASKVYDGSASSGTVTAGTLTGFVGSETVTVSSAVGTFANASVGTSKSATIVYTLANGDFGGLAANYSLANGSATGNITAATSIVDVTSNNNSSALSLATTSEVTVKGSAVLTIDATSEVKSLLTSTGTQVTVNQPLVVNTGGVTLAPNSKLELANTAAVTGNMEVGTDAKLNFTAATTLSVTGNLIFKADTTKTFSANIGTGGITVTGTVKYLKTINDKKWFFMSFPCKIKVGDITRTDAGALTLNTDLFIKYYDGANRAAHGAGGAVVNWITINSPTDSLEAYKGYVFGLNDGLGVKELSFPLKNKIVASESKDRKIPVLENAGSLGTNHNGWNLVGQPYLSKYAGANATGVNYMT